MQGWVREIARIVSEQAVREHQDLPTLDLKASIPDGLWIVPPDLVRQFKTINPGVIVFPVETPLPVRIEGYLGYLKIPKEFETKSLEIFDRWQASATLSFAIWFEVDHVCPYHVEGRVYEAQVL